MGMAEKEFAEWGLLADLVRGIKRARERPIAERIEIVNLGNGVLEARSAVTGRTHRLYADDNNIDYYYSCDCPGFKYRGYCKHAEALIRDWGVPITSSLWDIYHYLGFDLHGAQSARDEKTDDEGAA